MKVAIVDNIKTEISPVLTPFNWLTTNKINEDILDGYKGTSVVFIFLSTYGTVIIGHTVN